MSSSPFLPFTFFFLSPLSSLLLSLLPFLYCPPLGQYLEIFDIVSFFYQIHEPLQVFHSRINIVATLMSVYLPILGGLT